MTIQRRAGGGAATASLPSLEGEWRRGGGIMTEAGEGLHLGRAGADEIRGRAVEMGMPRQGEGGEEEGME